MNAWAILPIFCVSGFCGLLYQVIWVRIAYANFGIITPVLSVVISSFMLGLAVGSWLSGRFVDALRERLKVSAIVLYGAVELFIGVSAFAVPALYQLGLRLLLNQGETSSVGYLLSSDLVIAAVTLPWCAFMGATFPLMIAYINETEKDSAPKSFSLLYAANVLGAMLGTVATSFVLIELLGFKQTLAVGAFLNFAIAGVAFWLGTRRKARVTAPATASRSLAGAAQPAPEASGAGDKLLFGLLFSTGLLSMAMEVVWTRAYTPVLGNEVYSFAGLLFVYLLATCIGSLMYRRSLAQNRVQSIGKSVALLALFSFLPIVLNDPRAHVVVTAVLNVFGQWLHANFLPIAVQSKIVAVTMTLLSIGPFCALLGYLTPQLIDDYSAGSPFLAGRAYAINVVGCIIGPLFASYLLLPVVGTRLALLAMSVVCVLFALALHRFQERKLKVALWSAAPALVALALFGCISYEEFLSSTHKHSELRRDYAATVISCGEGFQKNLIVNGVGVTALDQCTKNMAHLPLVLLKHKPEDALTICFGMGTSFRSLLTWGIDVTAVELVPSVRDAFPYYFADAAQVMSNPRGLIVIDDGRRFLRRTDKKYDVIVIDPPPPCESAGLSLLLSENFYLLVKSHLKEGGILQEFLARGDKAYIAAALRSLKQSFPYVRTFPVPGNGIHCLASMSPIELLPAAEAVNKMPALAKKDLIEWAVARGEVPAPSTSSDNAPAEALYRGLLAREMQPESLLTANPGIRITDDRPFNEYFLLRRLKPASADAAVVFP